MPSFAAQSLGSNRNGEVSTTESLTDCEEENRQNEGPYRKKTEGAYTGPLQRPGGGVRLQGETAAGRRPRGGRPRDTGPSRSSGASK